MRYISLVSTAFLLLAAFEANATNDRLRLLGSTQLSKIENDRDVLRFAPCKANVSRLQLVVRKSDAEIETLVLRFGNGETQRVSVRDRLSRGTASRWIDVPGNERCLSAITVIGDSEGSRRKARVEFYVR